jgi:hypothetical protein
MFPCVRTGKEKEKVKLGHVFYIQLPKGSSLTPHTLWFGFIFHGFLTKLLYLRWLNIKICTFVIQKSLTFYLVVIDTYSLTRCLESSVRLLLWLLPTPYEDTCAYVASLTWVYFSFFAEDFTSQTYHVLRVTRTFHSIVKLYYYWNPLNLHLSYPTMLLWNVI